MNNFIASAGLLLLSFFTSLAWVLFSVPSIINLAVKKKFFVRPSINRKTHRHQVSNFGGFAIFMGFIFSFCLFIEPDALPEAGKLIAGAMILFAVGLYDDMLELGYKIKFLFQFVSALIVSVAADIRIRNLQGILGIYDLDYLVSISFTIVVIVGVINSFNLIDGIDGLAASLAVVLSIAYTYLFWNADEAGWACLSISLCGALLGFLYYNFTPARIFMGDSGSLLLGFIAVVLSIKFIDISSTKIVQTRLVNVTSGLSLVLSILIIPVFDTLRVFMLRMLRNMSPFKADNNHLHHRLLFLGLSHMQSTLVLVFANILFILMAASLQNLNNTQLTGMLVFAVLTVNGIFSLYVDSYRRQLLSKIHVKERPAAKHKSFVDEVIENISENK